MNRGCDDNNFSVPTPNGPSNIVVTEKMLHFSADTHAGGSGEPPTRTRPPTPNGPSNIFVTEKMLHFSADTHAGGSGEPPTRTRPPTPNGPSNIVVTETMSHFSADTHAGGSGEPPILTRLTPSHGFHAFGMRDLSGSNLSERLTFQLFCLAFFFQDWVWAPSDLIVQWLMGSGTIRKSLTQWRKWKLNENCFQGFTWNIQWRWRLADYEFCMFI